MTTEYIYHLTATELRDLMTLAITKWQELDHDVTAAVDAALAEDDALVDDDPDDDSRFSIGLAVAMMMKDGEEDDTWRLENSLPAIEEEEDTDEFDYDGWYPEHVLEIDDLEFDDRIPATKDQLPYADNNPAIPDSWYTVSTVGYTPQSGEFTATVDRETNQVDYEDVK